MLLKGKLKLPDKTLLLFPDREKDGTSKQAPEEELETFLPNGFALDREISEYEVEDNDESENVEFCLKKLGEKSDKDRGIISDDEKRSDLEYEVSQREINLEKLQRIASSGIPDGGTLRATTWKLLLGYLPESRDLWDKELAENRSKYAMLKEDLLATPTVRILKEEDEGKKTNVQTGDNEVKGTLERQNVSNEDHPLNVGKSSVWYQFFQFSEISDQIDRDLERTHPDLKFFSGETALSRKNREAMRNILLIFAKLNPEIRYVQGMNEVLAPLYFVFCTDSDEQNAANAEADSFSCFVRLLSDSVDHFCQHLDNSPMGIHSTLSRLSELLKANDEELWRHLVCTTKVNPQFFAFRWITLLLTQEFDFHSILRIWDTLLSNAFGVQDMLLRVCCAMVVCVKSRLMSGDFIANMKLLQHYPKINIEHVLSVAKGISPDTSTCGLSL